MSMSLFTAVTTPTVSAGTGRAAGTTDADARQPAAFAVLLQASVAAQNGGPGTGESAHSSLLGEETAAEPGTAPLTSAPAAAWGNWPTVAAETGTTLGAEEGSGTEGQPVPDVGTDSTAVDAAIVLAEPQLPPVAGVQVGIEVAATDDVEMPAIPAGSDTAGNETSTDPSVKGATHALNAAAQPPSSAGESSPSPRAGVVEGTQPVLPTSPPSGEARATAPAASTALPAPTASAPAAPGAAPMAPQSATASGLAPGQTGPMAAAAVPAVPSAAVVASAVAATHAPATPTDVAATSRQPEVSFAVPPVPVAPPQAMPPVAVSPVATAPAAPPAPLAAQVAPTLFTLVGAKPGEHVLTINVAPDNLGPVTVRAHVTVDSLRVELFAPTDAGRDALRAIMPDLRRDLAGSGLTAQLDLSSENSAAGQDAQKQRTPDARTRQPEQDIRGIADSEPPAHRASSASTIDVLA
jgi:flagellar hook-length control protein FliK